jgi:hypothetical protein
VAVARYRRRGRAAGIGVESSQVKSSSSLDGRPRPSFRYEKLANYGNLRTTNVRRRRFDPR